MAKSKIHLKPQADGVAVSASLEWKYTQDTASKRFIGICPQLHITLEADTLEELISLIGESATALLETVVKDGSIDEFMEANSWSLHTSKSGAATAANTLPRFTINPVSLHDFKLAACG